MENEKMVCHDCGKELKKGAEFVRFTKDATEDALKCRACYEAEPVLKNYQQCDVYSRVVGFHTPTGRWNKGKSAEWKDRKTFVVDAAKLCGAC
ncbi:anaerobic ribonucleoside-triphosphate reductase [Patescibacteria group bacterium]